MKRNITTGFSLIELLTIIAILAVLVALLLPSLGSARESAKSAQCVTNLKNLGSGITNPRLRRAIAPDNWRVVMGENVSGGDHGFLCPSDPDPHGGAAGGGDWKIKITFTNRHGVEEFRFLLPLEPATQVLKLSQEQVDAAHEQDYLVEDKIWPDPPAYSAGANPNVVYYCIEDQDPAIWKYLPDPDYNDMIVRIETMDDGRIKINLNRDPSTATNFYFLDGDDVLYSYVQEEEFILGGQLSSYGMNSKAKYTSERTVLLLDYERLIADAAGDEALDSWDDWRDAGDADPRFFRHQQTANVLFSDVSVKAWARRDDIDPDISQENEDLWLGGDAGSQE